MIFYIHKVKKNRRIVRERIQKQEQAKEHVQATLALTGSVSTSAEHESCESINNEQFADTSNPKGKKTLEDGNGEEFIDDVRPSATRPNFNHKIAQPNELLINRLIDSLKMPDMV